MGLVNSALNIGRSAITSYQSALSVVGNNIANAADPDYTRQQAVFEPVVAGPLPEGLKPGGGVALDSLQRVINEAVESRLREAIGNAEAADVEAQLLTQVESIFDELGDAGVSARLNELFRGFQDVQNLPANTALRGVAVDQAAALADLIRARRENVDGMTGLINDEVSAAVVQADTLASEIALLNVKIVEAETGGHVASPLRDLRDSKLRELGELMDITVRQQADTAAVSVYVGTESLVQLGNSRGLTTTPQVVDGRTLTQVEFGDGSGQIAVTGGTIGGLLSFRDRHLGDITAGLDHFAANLIEAFNLRHADGQGLEAFTTLSGTQTLSAADVPLDVAAADQAVVPRSGSFVVSVSDARSGAVLESVIIDINLNGAADDTTLNSLADQINTTVPGLSADVTPDHRLELNADPGMTFSFGHDGAASRSDTSHTLAALGLNTLFTGHNAADIDINAVVARDPERLAVAGANFDGDTDNIAQLIDLQSDELDGLDGATLLDHYNEFVIGISTATAEVRELQSITSDLRSSLQAQRDSLSGVNLDEEAVNLIKYERAFQGAARFTSVVDQMISEMLNIVR